MTEKYQLEYICNQLFVQASMAVVCYHIETYDIRVFWICITVQLHSVATFSMYIFKETVMTIFYQQLFLHALHKTYKIESINDNAFTRI